eukprot:TRINITY_DN1370_c0_g2_i1.p1 TRINITY_DN1370_c0_g2~~TRINITY_DN1370_c0_g2_i1.p1  ORF type:complete len:203 (-),score=32.48 TRINITY_DN1370_c0_g2_i1:235-843(-)
MANELIGWYDLSWQGGTFPICFRPAGQFFCPKFQAPAKWEVQGDCLRIDWAKYGKYEFKVDFANKYMEGYGMPQNPSDPNNWRKASFSRPLSPVELTLIGDGAGTEWDFEWSGGSFPVKFKADGYNHFQCDDHPAHAHWTLEGDTLKIHWGQYGNYELMIDPATKTMAGIAVGGNPATDWRKGKLMRNLINNSVVEACEHHH